MEVWIYGIQTFYTWFVFAVCFLFVIMAGGIMLSILMLELRNWQTKLGQIVRGRFGR